MSRWCRSLRHLWDIYRVLSVEDEESTILLYQKGFHLVKHQIAPFARKEWEVPSR